MPVNRPFIKEIFRLASRQLEVYFYTSNIAKYLHVKTVFEHYGLNLNHFRSKSDPYDEDYSVGKERLLARAIREVAGTVAHASVFFVEDTSLRIDALSIGDDDFPGLRVKEWFSVTTFEELDDALNSKNSGRNATVKSDIGLYLPGLSRPIFFHGETQGQVATVPPNFTESTGYPWLTPHSFNGWFIPDGSEKRLGEMTLEESWSFDFRTRAVVRLIDRLEEYTAALNLPPQSYVRRYRIQVPPGQLPLFNPPPPVYIVVGRTCAGKTTFGQYAANKFGFYHVEASSIVRMYKAEYETANPEIDISDFAAKLLETKGADIVARKVLDLYLVGQDKGVVISGFRTIEELELIKNEYPSAKIVLVEASERTRFQRHLLRNREGTTRNLKAFRELDRKQWGFGLLRVAEDIADIRIVNEQNEEYFQQLIDAVVTGNKVDELPGVTTDLHPRQDLERSQLYRCLNVLEQAGRPLTCEEIESMTAAYDRTILQNNANKVLKQVPELARRLEVDGLRLRYELLNAGRAYIRLVKKRVMNQ